MCLLLAIAIWFLIKSNLGTLPDNMTPWEKAPKAIPVDEGVLE